MKSHRKVFIFQAERKTDSRSPLCERSYVIISQINKSILFSGAKRRYLTETSDGKVTNECMALQEFLLIKKRAIYIKKYEQVLNYIFNCHYDIVKICQILNSQVEIVLPV